MFFWKMHGAGNDFIIFDKIIDLSPKKISELCNRREGIGADGLIMLSQKEASFEMRYYNSDGSRANFCGNGGRCAAYFAFKNFNLNNNFVFFADDGSHEAWIQADLAVKIKMISPFDKDLYNLSYQGLSYNFVNTGVEHVVAFVNNLPDFPVENYGRIIRNHSIFPNGTNVNFVEKNGSEIHIRTYERGVEAETLACGTGICAAAFIDMELSKNYDKRKIITKNNYQLFVEYDQKFLYLTGPALPVFKGELDLEF